MPPYIETQLPASKETGPLTLSSEISPGQETVPLYQVQRGPPVPYSQPVCCPTITHFPFPPPGASTVSIYTPCPYPPIYVDAKQSSLSDSSSTPLATSTPPTTPSGTSCQPSYANSNTPSPILSTSPSQNSPIVYSLTQKDEAYTSAQIDPYCNYQYYMPGQYILQPSPDFSYPPPPLCLAGPDGYAVPAYGISVPQIVPVAPESAGEQKATEQEEATCQQPCCVQGSSTDMVGHTMPQPGYAMHPTECSVLPPSYAMPPTVCVIPPPGSAMAPPDCAIVPTGGAMPMPLCGPLQRPLVMSFNMKSSGSDSISQHMERVWHGSFNLYLGGFQPHGWFLMPVDAPPSQVSAMLSPANLYLPTVPWRTFRDSAKVRFCCDSCGNGWTSMKGRVIFWFHQDPTTMMGYVLFKLYGQQCKRCSNGQFEHAMWYPDEVVKVIENLYHRVGQVYYNFYRPPLRIERRSGKPREQHNADLCQACKEGLCKEELMFT